MSHTQYYKKFFFFFFVSFLFFYSSCKVKNNHNKGFQITRDKSGNIIEKGQYEDDSIPNGILYLYYPNGNIRSKLHYKHGKFDGWQYVYYINRNIYNKNYYRDGKAEGKEYTYYINGNIKSITNYYNNKQLGDAFFYYPNGFVKLYNFYDFDQKNWYLKQFDSLGNVLKEVGEIYKDSLTVKYDSSQSKFILNYIILIPHPPKERIELKVCKVNFSGKYFNCKKIRADSSVVKFEYDLKNIDKVSVAIIGKKFDSVTNETKTLVSIAKLKDTLRTGKK